MVLALVCIYKPVGRKEQANRQMAKKAIMHFNYSALVYPPAFLLLRNIAMLFGRKRLPLVAYYAKSLADASSCFRRHYNAVYITA